MSAVIFDLDNTLIHRGRSIGKYADVFRDDFQRFLAGEIDPMALADRFRELDENGYAGHDKRSAGIRQLPIWRRPPSRKALRDHWNDRFPYHPAPMPGLYDTLTMLKENGFRLGIITNGSVKAQTAKIDALDLAAYFDCITISEQCGIQKPDSRIFHRTLRKMGQQGHESYFVGDHPVLDVSGAMKAGLMPVWLSGFQVWPKSMDRPAHIIDDLLSIEKILGFSDSRRKQV